MQPLLQLPPSRRPQHPHHRQGVAQARWLVLCLAPWAPLLDWCLPGCCGTGGQSSGHYAARWRRKSTWTPLRRRWSCNLRCSDHFTFFRLHASRLSLGHGSIGRGRGVWDGSEGREERGGKTTGLERGLDYVSKRALY